MLRRTIGRFLLVASALGFSAAARAGDPPAGLIEKLFRALAVQEAACPEWIRGSFRDDVLLACGRFKGKRGDLDAAWERIALENEFEVRRTPWIRGGPLGWRRYCFTALPGSWLLVLPKGDPLVVVAWGDFEARCRAVAAQEGLSWVSPRDLEERGKTRECSGPKAVRKDPVFYPWRAKEKKLAGEVLLQAVIDEHGVPRGVCVLGATPRGHGFEEAAVSGVSDWRYEPAICDGRPVAVMITFRVSFVSRRGSRDRDRLVPQLDEDLFLKR